MVQAARSRVEGGGGKKAPGYEVLLCVKKEILKFAEDNTVEAAAKK
jgi:hypothetical protein